MLRRVDVNSIHPILSVEDGYVISRSGEISVLYEVQWGEVFCVSESQYANLHETWIKAIRLLPRPCVVHKQDFYFYDKFSADLTDVDDYFEIANKRNFKERPYLAHKSYVYLTLTTLRRIQRKNVIPLFLDKHAFFSPEDKKLLEKFLTACSQIESLINNTDGISMKRLTKDDIIGYRDAEGLHLGLYDRHFTLGDSGLKDVFFDERPSDYFRMGDELVSIQAVSRLDDLPSVVEPVSVSPSFSTDNNDVLLSSTFSLGLGLSIPHIHNQYIFLDTEEEELKAVRTKVKRFNLFASLSATSARDRDLCEDYLDSVVNGGMIPARIHTNIVTWARTIEQLKENQNEILTRCQQADMHCRNVSLYAPHLFWGQIPGNPCDVPLSETAITGLHQGISLWTMETNYRSSTSPFGITLCDRLTGYPVHVDISDQPLKEKITTNRNKLILGPSGSGKSFICNHIMRQYYEQGAHIVIIDIGNSYEMVCKHINNKTEGKDGILFTYSEGSPISFNPFYVEDKTFDDEKITSISSIIFSIWKGKSESVSRTEEKEVDQSIRDFITKKILPSEGNNFSFNDYYEFLINEYSKDLQERFPPVPLSEFNINNLINILRPFYKGGQYDYLLNNDAQIDLLSKRFVIFEIEAVKDNALLFPLITIIVMETYLRKVKRLGNIRKVLVIEEAWKAIMQDNFATYIKDMYKTVRKHFGEAIVVTQELGDLLGNAIVKESIVTQSDCKILLDHAKYRNNFYEYQQFLGLSDTQVSQIMSINVNNTTKGRNPYKEVFIGLGADHGAVYAVEVSPEEAFAYNTDAEVKYALKEKMNQDSLSVTQAISYFANKKKKGG